MLPILCACGRKWTVEPHDTYCLIRQDGGQTLGYFPGSGVRILYSDGYAFKDLNRNGILDCYEDWRYTPEERAEDLAKRLSVEEIAGLMLYSSHQAVPTDSVGYWSSTYNGTSLRESGLPHSAVSDKQRKFLRDDNLRAVLVVRVESPRIAAEWNNNMQAFVEGLGQGIPVNISSDPGMKPEPGPNTTQGQEERFRCGPVRSGWPLRSTPNWSKSSDGSHPPNTAPWVSPQRCRRRSIWRPNPGGTGSTVPSAKTPIWTPIWRGPISTDSDLRRSCRDCGRLGV